MKTWTFLCSDYNHTIYAKGACEGDEQYELSVCDVIDIDWNGKYLGLRNDERGQLLERIVACLNYFHGIDTELIT